MTTNHHSYSSSDLTASSLLVRLKQRDPQAWRRLTDLYGPLVFGWCRRYGLPPQDAADVFQEVFAAVARRIDQFTRARNGGTFRGWLWTITRNKIRDFRRNQANRIEAAGGTHAMQRLADIPDELAEQSDESDRSETVSLFHRALELVRGEFEPRTWQAFWRVVVQGEKTADIAADLGITANGVRQAKSRVLRRLREELAEM